MTKIFILTAISIGLLQGCCTNRLETGGSRIGVSANAENDHHRKMIMSIASQITATSDEKDRKRLLFEMKRHYDILLRRKVVKEVRIWLFAQNGSALSFGSYSVFKDTRFIVFEDTVNSPALFLPFLMQTNDGSFMSLFLRD